MELLTLDQLVEAARDALREAYAGPADRRATHLPNRRSFRFYAARGLLGPPTQLRGRVGLYSQSHLHTLIAIKRLQAEGRTLDEIARQLREIDDTALAELARPRPQPRRPEARRDTSDLLREVELESGVHLRLDAPLHPDRRLERRLRKHARSLLRVLRAERRAQEQTEVSS